MRLDGRRRRGGGGGSRSDGIPQKTNQDQFQRSTMPRAGRRRRPSIKRQQYLYPILEHPSFNTPFPIPYPPFPTPLLLPPPFHALPLPTPVAKWGQIYYAGAASLPVNYTCPEARAPSSLRAPPGPTSSPPGQAQWAPGGQRGSGPFGAVSLWRGQRNESRLGRDSGEVSGSAVFTRCSICRHLGVR